MCERAGEALRMNIQTLRVKRCVYRHGDKAPTQTKGPRSQEGLLIQYLRAHCVAQGRSSGAMREDQQQEGPPPSSDTLSQKKVDRCRVSGGTEVEFRL